MPRGCEQQPGPAGGKDAACRRDSDPCNEKAGGAQQSPNRDIGLWSSTMHCSCFSASHCGSHLAGGSTAQFGRACALSVPLRSHQTQQPFWMMDRQASSQRNPPAQATTQCKRKKTKLLPSNGSRRSLTTVRREADPSPGTPGRIERKNLLKLLNSIGFGLYNPNLATLAHHLPRARRQKNSQPGAWPTCRVSLLENLWPGACGKMRGGESHIPGSSKTP